MKSALELAMEKAEKIQGGAAKKLTGAQKGKIAEIRSKAEAKIAEERIMLDGKLGKLRGHPEGQAAAEELEKGFLAQKASILEGAERKIEKIRGE